jgi:hypothetical protein
LKEIKICKTISNESYIPSKKLNFAYYIQMLDITGPALCEFNQNAEPHSIANIELGRRLQA